MPQQAVAWFFPILLILFFYFFLIRPQRKKEKAIDAMRKSVKAGDKVITIGGIRGRIVKEKEETLILEIGERTRIEVMRWSISSIVESTPKKKTVTAPKEENSGDAADDAKALPEAEDANDAADYADDASGADSENK